MRCPSCGHEFANPTAQAGGRAGGSKRKAISDGAAALGRRGAGVPKSYSAEERARRAERLEEARKKRWPEKPPK
jgi:hypothetical protein